MGCASKLVSIFGSTLYETHCGSICNRLQLLECVEPYCTQAILSLKLLHYGKIYGDGVKAM